MRSTITVVAALVLGGVSLAQSGVPHLIPTSPAAQTGLPNLDDEASVVERSCNEPESSFCRDSVFYILVDAMFLSLDDGDEQALVLNQVNGQTLLTSDDLDLDYQTGYRIAVGAPIGCSASVEVVYFGVDDWDAYSSVFGDNDLRIPGDLALATDDFFGADRIDVSYRSRIHNIEANYLQRIDGNFELLAGVRYIEFSEDFDLQATDADFDQSNYTIAADNRLYGGQIGLRWRTSGRFISLEAIGKAGIYGNQSEHATFVGDQNNTLVLRNSRSRDSAVSFVGEIGINGSIRLTEQVYFRAGYNLFYLQGVARATEQLDFTDTAQSGRTVRNQGAAFLHGATAGLEYRW